MLIKSIVALLIAIAIVPRPAVNLSSSGAYRVTVQHYLRSAPVLLASHGKLVTVGERLICIGPMTAHWALVQTGPATPQMWAFIPNLVVST